MKTVYFLIFSLLIFSCKEDNQFLLKDIDGNFYKTIKVGNTSWMAENLRTTHYQNGDPIIHLEGFDEWINTTLGAYCFYNNDDSIEKIYGKLYNWYSVDDDRNICPTGWQVPSYRDFRQLDDAYGGTAVSGKHLKLENELWYDYDGIKSDNSSGFSAIPAGHRNKNNFERLRNSTYFWNREDNYEDEIDFQDCCAHECSLRSGHFFLQDAGYKERGFSIRCVKNGFQKADSIIHYNFKIIDKKREEIIKYGSFEMLLTNEEWLPWDKQLKLIYNYDTAETGVFDNVYNEQTGWRKNNKEFYIHPPRSYDLEILEYAPFPLVKFDTSITYWVDTFTIPENSGWPLGIDNSTFYQKYELTYSDKFNYTAKAVSIRGSDTSYIRYNYNYKRGFTNYEYDILDSLTIFIYQE